MQIDLHGFHPSEIVFNGTLDKIVQQSWETGEAMLTLIHGHGRNRGITPGFVNTNTGYFGLCIRRALRHDESLRQWIKHTTLDCHRIGCTSIRLKPNPNPTRKVIDCLTERVKNNVNEDIQAIEVHIKPEEPRPVQRVTVTLKPEEPRPVLQMNVKILKPGAKT